MWRWFQHRCWQVLAGAHSGWPHANRMLDQLKFFIRRVGSLVYDTQVATADCISHGSFLARGTPLDRQDPRLGNTLHRYGHVPSDG